MNDKKVYIQEDVSDGWWIMADGVYPSYSVLAGQKYTRKIAWFAEYEDAMDELDRQFQKD